MLDTQVLYWMGESSKQLGPKTGQILRSRKLYFSSISVAELSFKKRFSKLEYDISAPQAWRELGIDQLNFGLEAANAFSRFSPEWVPDPFDRQIMAVAAANNLTLITSDRKILSQGFDWVFDATT